MNLPNYFLADLPQEATVTASLVTEACETLKRNREKYLASRSTAGLIASLSGVAKHWLSPADPFRQMALAQAHSTGFSPATLARGLDAFFEQVTSSNLQGLIEQDLGHRYRLDAWAASAPEEKTNRAAIATAPGLIAHLAAGNVPSPTLHSMLLGVLLRSAQFVKCATGATFLPRLFAHSLYAADPKLGACLEVAQWPGGQSHLEDALFAQSDCVTVTGSDETLAALRPRVPPKTRFAGYGHRVSFGFVSNRSLTALSAPQVVARAAADIAAWDQLGCLSPHVFYVEDGGEVLPDEFAGCLADALEAREQEEPRGAVPVAVGAVIASRRSFYEVRAAHGTDTRLWASRGSTAWTVVYEGDPRFQLSCLHRFVYVKRVKDVAEALQGVDPVRDKVSTVGLAAPEDLAPELALSFARWGAARVCPLGRMQNPPLAWRHDGRPPLADLVTWTDLEM